MVKELEEEGLVNSHLDHKCPKWGWPDCSQSGLFQKHWIQLLPSGIFMCLALKISTNTHSCRAGTILPPFSHLLKAGSSVPGSGLRNVCTAPSTGISRGSKRRKSQGTETLPVRGSAEGVSPISQEDDRNMPEGKKKDNCLKLEDYTDWLMSTCNEFLAEGFYLLIWTTQNEGRILVTQKLHQKENPDVLWIPPLMSYKCCFFHCRRKWWIFKHIQNKLFVITLDLQKKEGT